MYVFFPSLFRCVSSPCRPKIAEHAKATLRGYSAGLVGIPGAMARTGRRHLFRRRRDNHRRSRHLYQDEVVKARGEIWTTRSVWYAHNKNDGSTSPGGMVACLEALMTRAFARCRDQSKIRCAGELPLDKKHDALLVHLYVFWLAQVLVGIPSTILQNFRRIRAHSEAVSR